MGERKAVQKKVRPETMGVGFSRGKKTKTKTNNIFEGDYGS